MKRFPVLLLALALGACGERAPPQAPAIAPQAQAALGRLAFFDASLSASGRQSCASCHSPEHGYGPPNALAVQLGGEGMDRQGLRAVPSLRYVLARTPRWFKQYQRNPIEREIETDSVPTGGFNRDGRFDTLHEQARGPLFDPLEMANRDDAALAAKLRAAPYAAEFARVFGAAVLADDAKAVAALTQAIERFELDDPSFHPYSSRFDAYLRHEAELSPRELRGLRAFADPAKGNCASCHTVAAGADGSPPLFTDFSFAALGVPRNRKLAANADPAFFDEGLCGPSRRDPAVKGKGNYCGMFKTPSLRNVAARAVFMHNGVFERLDDAVRFYVQRDLRRADLPAARRGNIDRLTAPMDRQPGERPALDEVEVQDIVAFLRTLSDADVLGTRIARAR